MTRTLANYTVTHGPGDTMPADPTDVECRLCGGTVSHQTAIDAAFEFEQWGDTVDVLCDLCQPCSDCGGDHEAGTVECPWEVAS